MSRGSTDGTMADNLSFAIRGSEDFSVRRGTNSPQLVFERNENPKANPCRMFQFSNSGKFFCYCDSVRTVLVESATGKEVFNVELSRTQQVLFSPKDRMLATFEPYTIHGAKTTASGEVKKREPNLRLWTLPGGNPLTTLTAHKQSSWQIQWTDDEVYSVRSVGSKILVHKYNSFDKSESKLVIPKMKSFALSSGSEPHILAAYIPPSGGQPAVVQLRRLDYKHTMVATKTFSKCDKASLHWNCKGNALLVMATVDVDKSNKSHHGEQTIYLVSINGNSCMVPLAKNGPVHSIKWNPNGRQFAACYGFMPAHVTLYNLKGEATFDMGEGPRNAIFFNRFGNILLVCGSGKIAAGKMELWNVDDHSEIVKIQVPNTTYIEWAPDGQHFMTATTTPGLRMDNGYRIWHYSGRLIHETLYEYPAELWQVQWRAIRDGVYSRFPVSKLTTEDRIKAGLMTGSNKGAFSSEMTVVKSAMGNPDKKLRNLRKKMHDITRLKKRREDGETLGVTQLQKIEQEYEIIEEMEKLRV